MYFPVLRGKQFELIALRELSKLGLHKWFTPVIEPVKTISNPFIKTISELNNGGITPIVIINSELGEEEVFDEVTKSLLEASVDFTPCIVFDSYHTLENYHLARKHIEESPYVLYVKDISDESIFEELQNVALVLLEDKPTIASQAAASLKVPVVVIEDGFDKKIKNADYPKMTTFSSAISDYKSLGLAGFGDYTITGNLFSEGGGPAYVVALHLSQIIENRKSIFSPQTQIIVNHFCSENNGSYADPAGKFFEALEKLIEFLDREENETYDTSAISEFRKLYDSRHFPGLGAVKKLSVSHHVEIISKYIAGV